VGVELAAERADLIREGYFQRMVTIADVLHHLSRTQRRCENVPCSSLVQLPEWNQMRGMVCSQDHYAGILEVGDGASLACKFRIHTYGKVDPVLLVAKGFDPGNNQGLCRPRQDSTSHYHQVEPVF